MKCIKSLATEKVVRVKDKEAEKKVSSKLWFYVPKSEWKKGGKKYA